MRNDQGAKFVENYLISKSVISCYCWMVNGQKMYTKWHIIHTISYYKHNILLLFASFHSLLFIQSVEWRDDNQRDEINWHSKENLEEKYTFYLYSISSSYWQQPYTNMPINFTSFNVDAINFTTGCRVKKHTFYHHSTQ